MACSGRSDDGDRPEVDAEIAHVDASLASELIASRVTTQPLETVITVLAATRHGVDQRCRQGIWDQLQDGAADRGGCCGASAAAARGGQLSGPLGGRGLCGCLGRRQDPRTKPQVTSGNEPDEDGANLQPRRQIAW